MSSNGGSPLDMNAFTARAELVAGSDRGFSANEFRRFMGGLGVGAAQANNIFSTMSGGDFTKTVGVDRVVGTLFRNADTDGDLQLSRGELRTGLGLLAQPTGSVSFDRDAGVGGRLDRVEFSELARRAGVTDPTAIDRAFDQAAQGADSINADQFKEAFDGDVLTNAAFRKKVEEKGSVDPTAGLLQFQMLLVGLLVQLLESFGQMQQNAALQGLQLPKVAQQPPPQPAPVMQVPAAPTPPPARNVQATTTFSAGDSLSVQVMDPETSGWKEVASNRSNVRDMNFSSPLENLDQLKVRLVNNSNGRIYGSDDQNQARVTRLADGNVRVAFEDRPHRRSDKDFNDAVVTFRFA